MGETTPRQTEGMTEHEYRCDMARLPSFETTVQYRVHRRNSDDIVTSDAETAREYGDAGYMVTSTVTKRC